MTTEITDASTIDDIIAFITAKGFAQYSSEFKKYRIDGLFVSLCLSSFVNLNSIIDDPSVVETLLLMFKQAYRPFANRSVVANVANNHTNNNSNAAVVTSNNDASIDTNTVQTSTVIRNNTQTTVNTHLPPNVSTTPMNTSQFSNITPSTTVLSTPLNMSSTSLVKVQMNLPVQVNIPVSVQLPIGMLGKYFPNIMASSTATAKQLHTASSAAMVASMGVSMGQSMNGGNGTVMNSDRISSMINTPTAFIIAPQQQTTNTRMDSLSLLSTAPNHNGGVTPLQSAAMSTTFSSSSSATVSSSSSTHSIISLQQPLSSAPKLPHFNVTNSVSNAQGSESMHVRVGAPIHEDLDLSDADDDEMNPALQRWTPKQEEKLKKYVKKYGTNAWWKVSQRLQKFKSMVSEEACQQYWEENMVQSNIDNSGVGHLPQVEEKVTCNICHKTYRNARNLFNHMYKHTGNYPYPCDQCNKGFTSPSALRLHARSHSGDKPHQCDVCLQSFARAETLKRHRRIHTGERPFECSVCGRGFARMQYLNIHFRTHTGERPYPCAECGDRFTCSSNRNRHMRIVHGHK